MARPDLDPVGAQASFLEAALGIRATDVVVVGYGAAGAAAVRAANARSSVKHVVTVGTPWGPVAIDALTTGLSGDALRLLHRLQRPGAGKGPEDLAAYESSPLERMRGIVTRSMELRAPGALPDASAQPRTGAFGVHAVFGSLGERDVAQGLGAYVADGISTRLEARLAPAPASVTAVHAGLDLPVIDLDLGGLLVGAGVAVELCAAERDGAGLAVSFVRGIRVDLHLGLVDGWLVGGPGSTTGAGDVRWMSARVDVPFDGTPGRAELVLHEATGLGIDRERWLVRVDEVDPALDAVVPEVRGLLSSVMARLVAAEPRLGVLFELLGLRRAGGLDPAGLDRLLHDTAATVRAQIAAAPALVAAELRALIPGATGTGSQVGWTVGPAQLVVDLGTGAVTASVSADPVTVSLDATPEWARGSIAIGSIDAELGGARLVASSPSAPGEGVTASVEMSLPSRPPRTVPVWPTPDVAGLRELLELGLPALGLQGLALGVLNAASDTARPLVQQTLELL